MNTLTPQKFKLELDVLTNRVIPPVITCTLYYSSLKLLRQGRKRKEEQFGSLILDDRKYIRNGEGEYEPFAVFGKSTIALSELKKVVSCLEMEEKERGDYYCQQLSKQIKPTWK